MKTKQRQFLWSYIAPNITSLHALFQQINDQPLQLEMCRCHGGATMEHGGKSGAMRPVRIGSVGFQYRAKALIAARLSTGNLVQLFVSMAETNCARWRGKSVPVWLREKGVKALGSLLLV